MKVKDITPEQFRCVIGGCPAILQTNRQSLLIVGRILSTEEIRQVAPGRVGPDETIVEVPLGLFPHLLDK